VNDDGYFGERIALRYDEWAAEMSDPAVVEPVVDLLVGLAGSGRALELGIGTGRIALPLTALDPLLLRLAGRARPDGAAGRHGTQRAVERLDARPLCERQPQARIGLGETSDLEG
jgi:hypothetical protein